jgi:alginate O-acetyltransferase complex protein AlgI
MLFNTIDFAIFLPVVFALYWLLNNHKLKWQNALIVVASFIFYGWWDWRFLSLLVCSSIVDFLVGIGLDKTESPAKRKGLLWCSILINLGSLAFFKYFDFFLDNFVEAFTFLGYQIPRTSLTIVLPVGISFYTFQTMSYSIDVYRNKINPTKDFIAFSAFVSFFPQLVAGPIERAQNLLPQFYQKRQFNYSQATDGLRQILWGLFKKIVIADRCAEYANLIFTNSTEYSGSTLVLGAFFFTFQIYGDFSGYSDIAIGTSRLFGFNLMQNFKFPYFSRDVAEFWRRWHISLSTWFRDYLYIPLGGSSGSVWLKVRNTFIVFIVSGFWHGANWTFIAWGAINAIYFLPLLLTNKNRTHLDTVAQGKLLPSFKEVFSMAFTFTLTCFAWIFFRAESIGHAMSYISQILSPSLFSLPRFSNMSNALITLGLIGAFVLIEWKGRCGPYAISDLGLKWKRPFRLTFYYMLICIIFWFGGRTQDFIYFQF